MNRFALVFALCCCCCGFVPLISAESLPEIQKRVESMNSEQKQLLANQLDKFHLEDAAEQARVRKLHEEITTAPDAADLQNTMRRYHEWFKKLSPEQRVAFRNDNLRNDERIALIRKIQEEQRRSAWRELVKQLPAADQDVLYNWMKTFTQNHKERLLKSMPEFASKKFESISDPHKQLHAFMMYIFVKRGGFEPIRPRPEDFRSLHEQLSESTRYKIDHLPAEGDRQILMHSWILEVIWKKTFPGVDEKKLEDFSRMLPAHRLLVMEKLPALERERELRQMYAFSTLLGFKAEEMMDEPKLGPFGPGGMRPNGEGQPRMGDFFRRPPEGPPPEDRRPLDDRRGRGPERMPPDQPGVFEERPPLPPKK